MLELAHDMRHERKMRCASTGSHQSVWRADRSADLSAVMTERRGAPMKVYGIAEIARALDTDPGLVGKWRERHKLPAPDAELATGPVWLAGTIEPLLAAGGPAPKAPGQRLRKFRVTARMTAGPYPALTNDRRSHFQAAIAATHRTGYLKPPAVQWTCWTRRLSRSNARLMSRRPPPKPSGRSSGGTPSSLHISEPAKSRSSASHQPTDELVQEALRLLLTSTNPEACTTCGMMGRFRMIVSAAGAGTFSGIRPVRRRAGVV